MKEEEEQSKRKCQSWEETSFGVFLFDFQKKEESIFFFLNIMCAQIVSCQREYN